jgi:geranylgeranyl diphosphate synthase type II
MTEDTAAHLGQTGGDMRIFLHQERDVVNSALDRILPAEDDSPPLLHKAMRYSVFAGGKRLRPILVLAAGRALGASPNDLMPAACAVELVHTYSLIHDDLPAMDDDDLRRGQPTSHVVFGEAIAILAGDALQTQAFIALSEAGRRAPDPERWLSCIHELAEAIGSGGMAGGQCLDLQAEGKRLDGEELRRLHASKTGALLTACVRIGAILGGAEGATLEEMTRYGQFIGLAFQVVDDLLDVEGTVQDLGKRPGADQEHGKSTYPALLGLEGAHAEADRLLGEALGALEVLGARGDTLAGIARYIVERKH